MPDANTCFKVERGGVGAYAGTPPKSLGMPKMGGGRFREHGRLPGRIRHKWKTSCHELVHARYK